MSVEREGEDTWIRCMPVWVVDTLMRLPAWLESEDPAVRQRLLPQAYAEPEAEREWRQHITPELLHLFESRTEIIRKGLSGLQIESGDAVQGEGLDLDASEGITFALRIPGKHLSAWLTSLQAATHAVFLMEDLGEEDIGTDPRDETDPGRQLAMMRLLIMQELVAMLCEE